MTEQETRDATLQEVWDALEGLAAETEGKYPVEALAIRNISVYLMLNLQRKA